MSEDENTIEVELKNPEILRFVDSDEQLAWQKILQTSLATLNRTLPGTEITKPDPSDPTGKRVMACDTEDVASAAVDQADFVLMCYRQRNELMRAAFIQAQKMKAARDAGEPLPRAGADGT